MEKTEELNNKDAILYFAWSGIRCTIYWDGGNLCSYLFCLGDNILSKGNDFRPSPLHPIDSIDNMVSLLSFMTVQKGDTDQEYFKNYTHLHLEWLDSYDCERLKSLCSDYEDKECKFYKNALRFFKKKVSVL